MKTMKAGELEGRAPEAVLVDVREPGEFAAERLPGSVNVPLSSLEAAAAGLPKDKPLIVLCRGGQRSKQAAERLSALGFGDVALLEGGLLGCPGSLEKGPGGAWAMERQVRMAAGTLVVAGVALGWLAHPALYLLSAGVGAGLMFSAATDTCGMALLLAKLPWNRRSGGCAGR